MSRVNLSRKRTCAVDWCDVHRGRRKRGPHIRCVELDLRSDPATATFAKLHLDGAKTIERHFYTDGRWTHIVSVTVLAEPAAVTS